MKNKNKSELIVVNDVFSMRTLELRKEKKRRNRLRWREKQAKKGLKQLNRNTVVFNLED